LDSSRFGFAELPGRRQGKSKRLNLIKAESFPEDKVEENKKRKRMKENRRAGNFLKQKQESRVKN
jgi:hypothetical protein